MSSNPIAAVEVTVGGRLLRAEVASRLASVRVASRLSQPTQCEFSFATRGGAAAEFDECPLGSTMVLRMVGDAGDLFDGEVTCVELVHGPDGEAIIRVRAYDRLHRLRKRHQARVLESQTAAELAAVLTADLGFAVVADGAGPRHARIVQHRQNDLELLAGIAGRAGLFFVVDGTDLRLFTLEGFGAAVPLELGKSLLEARVEANLDRLGTRVTAFGWDPQRAEPFEESASSPRSGRRVLLDPRPADVDVDGEVYLLDEPGRSSDEVAAAAQASLDRASGGAVTISGVAEGDSRLRAGARVEVDGLEASVRGTYVLCEAVHTVDATGYHTEFSTKPPTPPAAASGSPLTLGTVTDVDDPEECGRVRISLPAHGNLDAGWFGVMCPGAGPGKGIVALPAVDDTVLVALPHAGPEAGVVLGGLYGSVRPPDPGVVGGAVKRWSLRTSEGLSVVLDDAEHLVRMEDRAGSFVELRTGLVRLHAEDADLVVEAPGRTLTVRANAVDFQQAVGTDDAYLPEDGGRP